MRPKIVLFGDSITEESFGNGGWGASLADLLRRKCRPCAKANEGLRHQDLLNIWGAKTEQVFLVWLSLACIFVPHVLCSNYTF
ncbi:hypothetical protein F2Q70_00027938 [Brassica cretica]|uniref:SGNH hydrolase-type esterase domain-containing protein n=1 Tax=Brassica cretica TaxID=69181 RepID=A0A8S9IJ15_BRACR|nr:hypothetical protein F2Q68_00027527 [Brassica cretica]KAF2605598.1 hypothetical protein F2Q70_00027938 [Brassica cretica]